MQHGTATRPARHHTVLGPILLLALGSAGCTALLGIEELGQGDAGTPDASMEDAGPMREGIIGAADDLGDIFPVTKDTVWAFALRIPRPVKLDKIGFLFKGGDSANIKAGIYTSQQGEPFEVHIPEESSAISGDGPREINVDDACLFEDTYWVVFRVDEDVMLGSSQSDASDRPILRVDSFSYTDDLPYPTIEELQWEPQGNERLNVYLVTQPPPVGECLL